MEYTDQEKQVMDAYGIESPYIVKNVLTGEYTPLPEGSRIRTPKQAANDRRLAEAKKNRKTEKFHDNNEQIPVPIDAFHKLSVREFQLVSVELKDGELALLSRLISHISPRSCGVRFSNIISFNNTSLQRYFSSPSDNAAKRHDRGTIGRHLNTLIKMHIVAKCNVGGYDYKLFVNPIICCNGSSINATLKHMFGDYQIRSKGMKRWKDLV